MPNFPVYCSRTYVNDSGNLSASGYYRSFVTQRVANMFPPWMHLRDNPRSMGQQFLSTSAISLDNLESTMNDLFKSKFIDTALVNEIDVLYRAKLPSNVDLTDASASGIRCIAAPSGCSPSGIDQIWLNEISDLEEFYYNILPTRMEIISSGDYAATIDDIAWNIIPSGIADTNQKKVDVWKVEHDLTWSCAGGYFRKQDKETLESYEIYQKNGTGMAMDMIFYDDMLWWVAIDGDTYYLHITNPKTQQPQNETLDLLASFDITRGFDSQPSGILIDEERTIWICDTNKTRVYEIKPRYDYFILDKENRYVYLREDYRDSGVFISNT